MRGIINLGNMYKKSHQSGAVYSINGLCTSLCGGCHSYGIPFILFGGTMQKMIRIGNIYNNQFGTGFAGNVWNGDGIAPSLTTAQGGGERQ